MPRCEIVASTSYAWSLRIGNKAHLSRAPELQEGPSDYSVTFFCDTVNKMVQNPIVGLNIKLIVSFAHNTFQTGEGWQGRYGNRVIDSL